jgi:hypothetical protein
MKHNLLSCGLIAFVTISSHGHPGHEPFSEGTKHFITNPNHLVPPLIFSVALFVAARFLKPRGERTFVHVAAITIAIVALLS